MLAGRSDHKQAAGQTERTGNDALPLEVKPLSAKRITDGAASFINCHENRRYPKNHRKTDRYDRPVFLDPRHKVPAKLQHFIDHAPMVAGWSIILEGWTGQQESPQPVKAAGRMVGKGKEAADAAGVDGGSKGAACRVLKES